MLSEILGTLFAGLGLFFIGVKLIGGHLKQMTGRGFRDRVARAVDTPWRGALLGVLAGALTQSTNAVTFIVTSMNTAGLLSVAKAMPVVTWANLGTSALVLVATLDIHLAVLYLLGLVGLAYYFDVEKSNRYRHAAGALLGVALLFLGLQLIKNGAAPLREMEDVRALLQLAGQSWELIFLMGAAVTLVAQSSATVSVIAVAMTHVGLLTLDQTLLLIYGAGAGSAASLWFMTANLNGTARQLALQQILLKVVAAFLMLALLALEVGLDIPLVKALVSEITGDTGTQAAWVYCLYQLAGGLAMTLTAGPVYRLLQHWSPPSHEEALAKPHYLYDQALDDAETALDLVEKEQARLAGMLPGYLSGADMGHQIPAPASADTLMLANQAVAGQIADFLTELMDRHADRRALDRMLNLQTRNRLLGDLRDGLHQLDQLLKRAGAPDPGDGEREISNQGMALGLTEAMHFILLALRDATASADPDDLALLRELTSDRAELMERLRHKLLRDGSALHYQTHEALFSATSLFERLVWIVRQYSQLLNPPRATAAALPSIT